jgi:hypothetical protein
VVVWGIIGVRGVGLERDMKEEEKKEKKEKKENEWSKRMEKGRERVMGAFFQLFRTLEGRLVGIPSFRTMFTSVHVPLMSILPYLETITCHKPSLLRNRREGGPPPAGDTPPGPRPESVEVSL